MNNKVFISYTWDTEQEKNEAWVLALARRLQDEGLKIILDKWSVAPGDMIASFMQKAIVESDKILVICTPRYKSSADNTRGAAGYESNIVATQILLTADHRKFITAIKEGDERSSVPTGLQGKYHIQLQESSRYEEQFHLLVRSLKNETDTSLPFCSSEPANRHITSHTDYYNLSFAVLATLGRRALHEYINYFRGAILKNPHDDRSRFGIGLCCLHAGLYDMAVAQLHKAVTLAPDEAEYHYYYALSLAGGKNPGALTDLLIQQITTSLSAAIGLDDFQAKYYAFLLIIHFDYFKPKGDSLSGWETEKLEINSRNYFRDDAEIKRLAALLSVNNSAVLNILFNQIKY